MQIIRAGEGLAAALTAVRGGGATLALVPTMGALHAGHLKLVEEARRHADRVAATIFVNPLQFGAGEDLDRYPRQEERDAELLERAGCDLLWLPTSKIIYPDDFATTINVAGVTERWEGEVRPGHFTGVATVVAKLLLALRPDVALFGEKDFQQLAVIRQLERDLGLGVRIVGVSTVREDDGLALSSRNAYLSPDERSRAAMLFWALEAARLDLLAGWPVAPRLAQVRKDLARAGFDRVDYVALVDEHTLEPLDAPRHPMRLIAAARIGTTRLIDNLPVAPKQQSEG